MMNMSGSRPIHFVQPPGPAEIVCVSSIISSVPVLQFNKWKRIDCCQTQKGRQPEAMSPLKSEYLQWLLLATTPPTALQCTQFQEHLRLELTMSQGPSKHIAGLKLGETSTAATKMLILYCACLPSAVHQVLDVDSVFPP